MRIIVSLLQVLAIVVLVLATFLLVIDPRLRSLAIEDLSLLIPGAQSPKGESTTTQGSSRPDKAGQGPPTVTESGYTIASGCALWSVEGFDLYYSPADPTTICVQPPGSPTQTGSPPTSGTAQVPPNCAVAPDGVVYCLVGGQLTPDTLRVFYERGELQTPREAG